MSNGDHILGSSRLGSILNRVDYSRCGEKENDHDQYRNDCPGQLNLHASIHLSRFTATVDCAPTESNDRVKQQCKDREEDDSSNDKYKDRQVGD